MEITDVASLKSTLQLAIELEYSTIPPYSAPLLDREPEREVAAIIRSVVIEEMLHMGRR